MQPGYLIFIIREDKSRMGERKAIGYFRISGKSGALMRSELEGQRQALRAYAEAKSLRIVDECVDYENGKRAERPQFAKALASCRAGDTILIIPAVGPLAKDPGFYVQVHVAQVDFVCLDRPDITQATLLALGQEAYRADIRRKAMAS